MDDERSAGVSYGRLEAALAAATGLETADVRNRLRHLRRVNVPADLPRIGSGNAILYSAAQGLAAVIGLRLAMIDVAPKVISGLIGVIAVGRSVRDEPKVAVAGPKASHHPALKEAIRLAAKDFQQPDREEDGNLLACMFPAAELMGLTWPTPIEFFELTRDPDYPNSLDWARHHRAVCCVALRGEARLAQFVAKARLPDSYSVVNVSSAARKLFAALAAGPSA